MGSGTGPFRDYVFSGLVIGRKGKRDTGESRAEIDTDDELRLVAIRCLDLDGGVTVLGLHARWDRHVLLGLHAIARRRVHGLLHAVLGVLHVGVGVDGGGVLGEGVMRVVGHWTRRTVSSSSWITRWSA